MTKHLLPLLPAVTFCLACGPTKDVDCPPKFTIYKSVNKAYPVYARDFDLHLRNAVRISSEIEDTASLGLKSNVVKLRTDLNNISSRVEMLTKSNLMSYFAGICDPEIRKGFQAFQNRLADITLELTRIEEKLVQNRNQGTSKLEDVTDAIKMAQSINNDLK